MGNSQKSQRKKFYQLQQQIVFEALNDNQGSDRRRQPPTSTNTFVGTRSTIVGGGGSRQTNSVFATRMGIGKQMSTQSSSTPPIEQQSPSLFVDLLCSISQLRGNIIHRIERQHINIRPCVDQSDLGSSGISLATADDEELSRQERVALIGFCEEHLEKYESVLLSTLQQFKKYYVNASSTCKDQWEQFTADISSYKDANITLPAHFRTHVHNTRVTQVGGGAFDRSQITTHLKHTQSEAPSTFLSESKKPQVVEAVVFEQEGDSSSSSRQFEEFQLILRLKNEETQQQLNFQILSRIAAAFSSIFLASYCGGGELPLTFSSAIEQHFKLIFIYILQAFEEVVAFFLLLPSPRISSSSNLALPIASWVTGAMKDVSNKIRELFWQISQSPSCCFDSKRFKRLAALPENAVGQEYCNSLRIFKQLQPAFKKNPIKAAALISEQLNKIIAIEYGHAQQAAEEESHQYALGAEQLLPIYRKLIIQAEAASCEEVKSSSLYFSLRLFDVVFAELQEKTPSFSQHVLSVAHLLKEYTVILYE